MKKVLLTTMFGALFMTSSLSAKAQAGSVSGKVAVSAGVAFTSNVKTSGKTAVGGVSVTEAKAAGRANTATHSVFAGDLGGAAAVPGNGASFEPATKDFKKKTGAVVELTAGGAYWCTDSFGIGLDLGFGVANAKIEDENTGDRSKISNSFSIMPTATYYMTDNLVLSVGAGVAWTKVKDVDYTPEEVATANINVAAAATKATFEGEVKALLEGAAVKGKFLKDITATNETQVAGDITVADKLAYYATALNAHNAAVIDANKSFKTKPCFTAKVAVSYVLGENSQISLGYKFTGVKTKTKDGGEHELKASMHTITATYAYHF